jgi:guanosine-3',5'-bis(diphosphate) 3'-pyrophosphohydrolase
MHDLEARARTFAQQAHAGQRYGDFDFLEGHLGRVVSTLHKFGEDDPVLLAAAWLHDTVEDTQITVEDIKAAFGDDVADLVWRLTDETDGNRKERHHQTHLKIRGRTEAVRIKLADRIANVETSIEQRTHLRGMYRAEHEMFQTDLYTAGEYEDMWHYLNRVIGVKT